MSVIGIDLGTNSSTVAVIRSGGIDIVVNEVSNRRTPSVVGFTPKQRMIGEAGFTQRQRNIKNTVSGLKRIIGRNFEDTKLKTELYRLGGCNWVSTQDGSIGVQINVINNTPQIFSSQQLTAMYLAHLIRTTEKYTRTKASNVVISVPSYFSDAQRRAVLDAAKIANITCLGVINDISAVALLYGFYREVEKMNSKVMFIDVGASDMSVAIAHFTPNQCLILASTSDAFTGGLDIDSLLADYFAARFLEKTKLDIKKNERAWQRLMDGVEKVKRTLNENDRASLNIECILDDRDLNDFITRNDYASLLSSSGLLERLAVPINAALKEAGIEASSLDSIEWVGSAMRATPLQDAVSKILGRPISSTMNAEESVAKGCSLACALQSPLIKLGKKYKLIDTQPVPITLSWKSLNDKESTIDLFPQKQQYGKVKYVTLNRKDTKPFDIVAQYVNYNAYPTKDVSKGVVATGRVTNISKEPDNVNKEAEIRLKIKLDSNGLTHIQEAELVEKKEVEIEVEIKEDTSSQPPAQPQPNPEDTIMKDVNSPDQKTETKDKDVEMKDAEPTSEQKPESKDKDVEMKDAEPPKPKFRKEKQLRTFYNKVTLEVKYVEYTAEEIKKAIQTEEQLSKIDQYAIATLLSKNNLESLIFSSRDNLDTIWAPWKVQEETDKINQFLLDTEDWLYNEGSDTKKEEYDAKTQQLNQLLSGTKGRYEAELKRIEDERKAEEKKRLEEQKKIEEEKKRIEEEQKKKQEEEKIKQEEELKKASNEQQQASVSVNT